MDQQRSQVYRDVFGGWRWEAADAQGDLVDSHHSFTTREECLQDCSVSGFKVEGAASRSVLCVEPDRACRERLQQAFSGHRIVFAGNAYEALRNLHVRVFDLYVLEYWLPDLSGVSLCREIRKIDPRAPILFCTSAVREDARSKALKAGASAYICKPVDTEILHEQMRILLDKVDAESLFAKLDAERAIQDELERRAKAAAAQTEHARALAASATERAARAKAFKAFMESGGTRANFERWWPQLLTTAWATHRLG